MLVYMYMVSLSGMVGGGGGELSLYHRILQICPPFLHASIRQNKGGHRDNISVWRPLLTNDWSVDMRSLYFTGCLMDKTGEKQPSTCKLICETIISVQELGWKWEGLIGERGQGIHVFVGHYGTYKMYYTDKSHWTGLFHPVCRINCLFP